MQTIVAIALNTFREARRNRIFYTAVVFAVGFILFSVLFTGVTFVSQDRVLRDVGFGTINLFGVGLAIFLGIGMVSREIEKRTIYTVISKPVPRWAFIFGKNLGLMLTLSVTVGLMFVGFIVTLVLYRSPVEWVVLEALYGVMLELAVVVSFAVFCSAWTSSTLAAFFTIGFALAGNMSESIQYFGKFSHSAAVKAGSTILYTVLPDLGHFNLKPAVAYLRPVPIEHLLEITGYSVAWVGVFVVAATVIFSRRDFR